MLRLLFIKKGVILIETTIFRGTGLVNLVISQIRSNVLDFFCVGHACSKNPQQNVCL